MSWFAANPHRLVTRLAHLQAGFGKVGHTLPYGTVDAVAAAARVFVHVRSGDTLRSIRTEGVNQYAARVVASGPGAVAEERRGGDHAFLTRAVAAVAPQEPGRYRTAILAELQE